MKVEIDTMLKEWPAPARAESSWEERADAIVRAAQSHEEESGWGEDGDSGLFTAPALPLTKTGRSAA